MSADSWYLTAVLVLHFQVVAGIMSILGPDYGQHLTLYMHPLNFEGRQLDFGLNEFMQVRRGMLKTAEWG